MAQGARSSPIAVLQADHVSEAVVVQGGNKPARIGDAHDEKLDFKGPPLNFSGMQ
jgi:hypothetical protein